MAYDFVAAFRSARETNTHSDGDRRGVITVPEARAIIVAAQSEGATGAQITDAFENLRTEGRRLLAASTLVLHPPDRTQVASGHGSRGDARLNFDCFAGNLIIRVRAGDRTSRGLLFDAALASTYQMVSDTTRRAEQLRALYSDHPELRGYRDMFVEQKYPAEGVPQHGSADGVDRISFELPESVLAPR